MRAALRAVAIAQIAGSKLLSVGPLCIEPSSASEKSPTSSASGEAWCNSQGKGKKSAGDVRAAKLIRRGRAFPSTRLQGP